MKSRVLWIVVVLAAIGGFYFATIHPMLRPAQPGLNKRLTEEFRPPEVALPPLPEPKFETPTIPLPLPGTIRVNPAHATPAPGPLEVPIQPSATIDFSTGAPVVRSQGSDKEALEKALKEMADATKDVKFPAPAPEKK